MTLPLHHLLLILTLLTHPTTSHLAFSGDSLIRPAPALPDIKLAVPPSAVKKDFIVLGGSLVNVCIQLAQVYHQDSLVFKQPIDTATHYGAGWLNCRVATIDRLLHTMTNYIGKFHLWRYHRTIFIERVK